MFYSLKRISNWYTNHNKWHNRCEIQKKYYLHFPKKSTQYINIKANDMYEYQIMIGTSNINNGESKETFEIFGMDHASCVYLLDQNKKEIEWQIKKFIL